MQNALPVFDSRADAESYAETLHMQGYERSMGWDVIVRPTGDGDGSYEVALRKIGREA